MMKNINGGIILWSNTKFEWNFSLTTWSDRLDEKSPNRMKSIRLTGIFVCYALEVWFMKTDSSFFPWFHIKIRLTYNSLLASDNDFLPSCGNITVLFRSTLTWTIILQVQLLFLVANQLFYIGLYVYVDKIWFLSKRVHIVYFWVTQLTYIFQHHSQSVPLQTWTHKRFGSDPALQVKSVGDMTSI